MADNLPLAPLILLITFSSLPTVPFLIFLSGQGNTREATCKYELVRA
jgi:hypothetical protein